MAFRHSLGCRCCEREPDTCEICVAFVDSCVDTPLPGIPYQVKQKGEPHQSGTTDGDGKACWEIERGKQADYTLHYQAGRYGNSPAQGLTYVQGCDKYVRRLSNGVCCNGGGVPNSLRLQASSNNIDSYHLGNNPFRFSCCPMDPTDAIGHYTFGGAGHQWQFVSDPTECEGSVFFGASDIYTITCEDGLLRLTTPVFVGHRCGTGCPEKDFSPMKIGGDASAFATSVSFNPFMAVFELPSVQVECPREIDEPPAFFTIPGHTVTVFEP